MNDGGDYLPFVPIQYEQHGQQSWTGSFPSNRQQHPVLDEGHGHVLPAMALDSPERAFSQNAFTELDLDASKKHDEGTFGIKHAVSAQGLKDPIAKHLDDISTQVPSQDQALRAVQIANQMANEPAFQEKITPEVDNVIRAFRWAVTVLLEKNTNLQQDLALARSEGTGETSQNFQHSTAAAVPASTLHQALSPQPDLDLPSQYHVHHPLQVGSTQRHPCITNALPSQPQHDDQPQQACRQAHQPLQPQSSLYHPAALDARGSVWAAPAAAMDKNAFGGGGPGACGGEWDRGEFFHRQHAIHGHETAPLPSARRPQPAVSGPAARGAGDSEEHMAGLRQRREEGAAGPAVFGGVEAEEAEQSTTEGRDAGWGQLEGAWWMGKVRVNVGGLGKRRAGGTPAGGAQDDTSRSRRPRFWSRPEHQRFLEALEKHHKTAPRADGAGSGKVSVGLGQGVAELIAAHVGTRTVSQVRSHAQKHFLKQSRLAHGPADPDAPQDPLEDDVEPDGEDRDGDFL